MKKLATMLSALTVLQLTCWPLTADAAAINFTPRGTGGEGSLTTDLPAPAKIGKLKTANGTISIKGDVVDVLLSSTDLTKKVQVLSGVVTKSKVQGKGTHVKISGLCYWTGGSGLVDACNGDPNAEELIDMNDGGVVQGHITAISSEDCEVDTRTGKRRIAMAMINTIHSTHAYSFTVPVIAAAAITLGAAFGGTAQHISFSGGIAGHAAGGVAHAAAAVKPSQVAHAAAAGHAAKIMVIGGVCAGVATAIAVPVAVGVSAASNNNSNKNALQNVLLYNILSAPTPVKPVSSGP